MSSAQNSNRDTWVKAYENGYADSVMSVTPSIVVQKAVMAELSKLPFNSSILFHGNGVDDILPPMAAQFANVTSVVCTDFPEVIEQAQAIATASETAGAEWRSKISYVGMDAHNIGQECPEEFDVIIAINSIVAESRKQNEELLKACFAATKPKGSLIGLFPTIEYSKRIINTDLREQPWKRFLMGLTVNQKAQTITGPSVGRQHFPDAGHLSNMIFDAGYSYPDVKRLVLDDPAALEHQRRAYNKPVKIGGITIADFTEVAFSPVFENFVVARKPEPAIEPTEPSV